MFIYFERSIIPFVFFPTDTLQCVHIYGRLRRISNKHSKYKLWIQSTPKTWNYIFTFYAFPKHFPQTETFSTIRALCFLWRPYCFIHFIFFSFLYVEGHTAELFSLIHLVRSIFKGGGGNDDSFGTTLICASHSWGHSSSPRSSDFSLGRAEFGPCQRQYT